MKETRLFLSHALTILCLIVSTLPQFLYSQDSTDTILINEKIDCLKNTAYTWDSSKNRCVQKIEAQKTRQEVDNCSQIKDSTEKSDCYKKIAEQKSSLNSDPNSLNSTGGKNKSSAMNLINDAYLIVGWVNGEASKERESDCTSKKIFGLTATAGTLTDFYLKAKARAKTKELIEKYKIDVKDNDYNAQVKAFQYLKEEQNTVAEIASMEKKRNMLLMIGYGIASAFALAETMNMFGQSNCLKAEPKNEKSCTEDSTQSKCQSNNNKNLVTCSNGSTVNEPSQCPATPPVKKCEDGSDGPTCPPKVPEPAPAPAAKAAATSSPGPQGSAIDQSNQTNTASGPAAGAQGPVNNNPVSQESTSTSAQSPVQKRLDFDGPPVVEEKIPETELKTREVSQNGKKVAYYETKIDGKKCDVIDDKIFERGSNKEIGKLDYETGNIKDSSGKTVAKITKVTGANTSWIPNGDLSQTHNKMPKKKGG